MRFTAPLALFLALVPIPVLALRYWLRRRYWGYTGDVAWSSTAMSPRSWRYMPNALVILATTALAIALADPHVERSVVDAEAAGRAIVITLDLSFSMQERVGPVPAGLQAGSSLSGVQDPRPTRLEVLKLALKDFVSLRRNDRIGLVAFSENAYVLTPLTTDYGYLAHYIDMIDGETLNGEGYTAIGEGVAAASALLAFEGIKDGRRGIVLVFTDGESNFGRDPIQAVELMHQAGHRGYLIGVDLPEYVTTREQVRALIQSFEETGGRYYDAKSGPELENAYRDVSVLEADPLRLRPRTEDRPVYAVAVTACLVLLGASLALRVLPPFVSLT